MQLKAGQVAVVTGGASGFGRALANQFASRGLDIVLGDIDVDHLGEAVAEIEEYEVNVLGVRTDVMYPDQVDALAAATLERFGHVDVICNNAGVSVIGPFAWETPLNDWEWVMRVNLGGVVNGIRAFVPHLVAQGSGHVVNTSSMAGITKTTLQSPYTASKFAVAGVSEGLRAELDQVAPDVGVTVVFPGILKTNILASESHRPAALAAPRPPQREELWEHVGVCANAISGDEEMGAPDAAAIVVRAIEANRLHVAPNGRSAAARSLCDSLLLDIEQR